MRTAIAAILGLGLLACNGSRNAAQADNAKEEPVDQREEQTASNGTEADNVAHGTPIIVYRTKQDHSEHVPVIMNDDRSAIVSYPHPSDLKGDVRPVDLGNGYLLDRRGIGPNVAYLDMTYAQYAALSTAPSLAELQAHIIDRDPLSELYDCGKQTGNSNTEEEFRTLVASGQLGTRCKKLK